MKAIRLKGSGGLERLTLVEMEEPGAPQEGEILVRLHASSLNYHDYLVALGTIPTADGLIPLADGAGIVERIGEGVSEFTVGDHVVSCFFPEWQNGDPVSTGFAKTPGDGVDGYARERVVRTANWFTRAPKNYSHTEAATLTTAGLTAWRALVSDGPLKAGETVLTLGTGGVSMFALQFAKMMGALTIVTSCLRGSRTRITIVTKRSISSRHKRSFSRFMLFSDRASGVFGFRHSPTTTP